ncbi:MAG: lipid-A-disaccharide synthase [Deltaproteobacteria bacterium RIFOXYD12_FULL_50_9]|nr:MAG: lipid-A-disaccharide synthase [Deltaproteobacteria bacterium RIFOXYD12_FULL_50_9]
MTEKSIMIVAGEASGDMHGARLVRAMHELDSNLTFCGMGSVNLKAAGVEMLCDAARIAVVGLTEVIGHLSDIRAALRTLEQRMRENPPGLLILIDFPDFNLMLAAKAKRLGIPIFYYISPQVWAWRSNRVKKIGRLVNRMAVILPFEQKFYADRGVAVDFVGHPLLDAVHTSMTRQEFLHKYNIPAGLPLVGILPGSRKKEIMTILPIFLETAKLLVAEHGKIVFLLPLAATISENLLYENGLIGCDLDIRIIRDDHYDLMSACSAVMAASGTVTLELTILQVPMVVAYRISPLTHFLGHRLIKVKYAALANLVANRPIVPELLQQDANPAAISKALSRLLTDEKTRTIMITELAEVTHSLGEPGTARRVAALALATISSKY